jgi:Domain of unknown function (DUF4189)
MRKSIAGAPLVSLTRVLAVLCFAVVASCVSLSPASAQITNETPPPGYPPSGCDYDQRGNYYCWGGGSATSPDRWAALALSPTRLVSGTAHGQASQDAARTLAEGNCRSAAPDCELKLWGKNTCVAIAVSLADGKWGDGISPNRERAEDGAIALCRSVKGKNCVVQAASCASDDPRMPSPSPAVTTSSRANTFAGCYRWSNGGEVVIQPNHTAVAGPFSGTWALANTSQRTYTVTWSQAVVSKVTISADQRSLRGGNQYGGIDSATRIAGSSGLVGRWRWSDSGTTSTVTVSSNGTFSVVASNATWHGTWRPVTGVQGSYALTVSDTPKANLKLAADGSSVSGADQYGNATSGVKMQPCSVN